MPAVEADITPPDSVKDVNSLEKTLCLSPEAEAAKDCRKGLKGKNTMSTKSGAASAAPRITIKLVAKKKKKAVKEPHKKSPKKVKIKGIQDPPKAEDIQGDQISSAHVKLKTEPQEDKHGTEDKGGGTEPARRRGRSATKKTDTVCQDVADDRTSKERKSPDQFDTVKESGAVQPKTNAKKLKHTDIATDTSSEVNQQVVRRSNRVTIPLTKKILDSAAEPESLSYSAGILVESKPEVSQKVETKPQVRGDGRRQSKRLNKDATVPENHGTSSTETDPFSAKSRECLSPKNDEMRVPSLKLMKIRNPKFEAQASGKNLTRKKRQRKKFVWALSSVKGESPTQGAESTVKITEKTVQEVDQSTFCDTNIKKSLKVLDKQSKLDNPAQQESASVDSNETSSQIKVDVFEEKSDLQVEVEVEQVNETTPQEITKTDCVKVPPLQIKKVSSPGKHKSSKPSFLIQQVSPVSENVEDVIKDPSEVHEDEPACLDDAVTPTRRLRRRTASFDSPPTKSAAHKPVTTQKRRLRTSSQDKDRPPERVEDALQASTDESSPLGLPTKGSPDLPEDPSLVTNLNSAEVPKKDSSNVADEPPPLAPPVEVTPEEKENEVEPQIEEAKPVPVPSKPRRCRTIKTGKKRSAQSKAAVVSAETAVPAEVATVEATITESVVVSEVSQSEAKECTQLEPQQDTVSVEEKQMLSSVKEETEIQLIDSQHSVVAGSQIIDPKPLCLQKKSHKKGNKKRKNVIGPRPKHRFRSRDGKFAPLKLSESQNMFEGDVDISAPVEAASPTPSTKLVGVHKKHKKRPSGLHVMESKRLKPPCKIISQLMEMGLNDSLKQEETDTLVDRRQADVVDSQPSKSKFVKNIKHFIMPVVSARSSRVIKTPQRFMDDAGMSVLPRRNSPKKGFQFGLQMRPAKGRDDGMGRAISPILPIDEEDILSEAQLDMDLFSSQDLDDDIDLAESLFSDRISGRIENKSSMLKNSTFEWHVPRESSEDLYTLDKTSEDKCEDLYLSTALEKPTEASTDLLDVPKKKSFLKFNKQAAKLRIFQRLRKAHTGLPKSRIPAETDSVSKPLQPPVDLAEGLDDEAMSISLRQRNTNAGKDKSKLKIEDLDSPGVVRKVSVCVRTLNSKSLAFQQGEKGGPGGKDPGQIHFGKQPYSKSIQLFEMTCHLLLTMDRSLLYFYRRAATRTEVRCM